MRIAAPSLAFVCFVTAARSGSAEQIPGLVVERGPGAEQCPDGELLGARIQQIRGRSAHELATSYHVVFTRKDDVFSAVIRTGPNGANVRTLENGAPSCASLASATAVTLALLFDSDVVPPKPPEQPPPPPAPTAVPPPAPPPERAKFVGATTVGLGAMGLIGVIRPIAPAFTGEIGFVSGYWRVSLGAIVGLPQTLSLGTGKVHEELWSGSARLCLAPWKNDSLRFDVCSGALVGFLSAEAEGYFRNETKARPWVAMPLELAFSGKRAPLGWEVAAGGIFPIRRPDFLIDNLGVAYASPKVGAEVSLRAIGIFPW